MAPSAQRVAVFMPLIIGLPTTLGTIVIHCVAGVAIVHFFRYQRRLGHAGVRFWKDVAIIASTAMCTLTAHLVEITIWGAVFELCGEFTHFGVAVYHSAMNYTTLGYGDVVMSSSRKLFGPLEAADGMLMFGVSTAMVFAVVQQLIQTRFPDSGGTSSDSAKAVAPS
jgi:hypothetical protein